MGFLKHSDVYRKFSGQCAQCGRCTPACKSLEAANMTLGQIARAMLAAERGAESAEDVFANILTNPQLVQAVRGCFFCTSCKNTCFAHNDVCDLIYHARADFLELGLIPRSSYSSVLVDQEWDVFTAYRAVYGIGYADLTRHVATDDHEAEGDCEGAFFPSCSLATYAPELTREIFEALEELGGKTTLIDHCCGSPLKSAGFFDRAEALCDLIAREVADSGAKTLVCVCPGCANAAKVALERNGVETDVVSLAAFLTEHDFKPRKPLPERPLHFAKPCQDRNGIYLKETCVALGVDAYAPSIFYGCCGAGGAVDSFDPYRPSAQTAGKLSFAADGSTLVTMCPTCTYTYAANLLSNPRDLENKNYTELMFESQVDWGTVFKQLEGMWTGEYGPWVASVLS